MDEHQVFSQTDEVMLLGGFFFLKLSLIKKRDPMVEDVLQGLYDFVSLN